MPILVEQGIAIDKDVLASINKEASRRLREARAAIKKGETTKYRKFAEGKDEDGNENKETKSKLEEAARLRNIRLAINKIKAGLVRNTVQESCTHFETFIHLF